MQEPQFLNSTTYEQVCKEIAIELESLQNPNKEMIAVIKKSCSKHKIALIPETKAS